MPAGNPKGQGPSAEARARSAAARRRQADERLAAQLYARGWILVAPERAAEVRGGASLSLDDEWWPAP